MNLGGTMRLGAFPCSCKKDRCESYDKDQISERHRHRYEFNNDYRERFEKAGMILPAFRPNGMLVEMVELKTIRGSWACSFIRSSNRGRSIRIRFSGILSARA